MTRAAEIWGHFTGMPSHESLLPQRPGPTNISVSYTHLKNITDWEAYKTRLHELMGQESKLTRQLYETARRDPQPVSYTHLDVYKRQ